MQFAVNNVQRAVCGGKEASNYYRSPVEVGSFSGCFAALTAVHLRCHCSLQFFCVSYELGRTGFLFWVKDQRS